MGTITIVMDDEVEKKLRSAVHGKGALGEAISNATNKWLEGKNQEKIKTRLDLLLGAEPSALRG